MLLLVGLSITRTWQQPTLASSTYTLGNLTYYVAPTPVSQLFLTNSSEAKSLTGNTLVPFTVISANGTGFTDDDLSSTIASYQANDDVWTTDFLTGECLLCLNQITGLMHRRHLRQFYVSTDSVQQQQQSGVDVVRNSPVQVPPSWTLSG